MTEYDEHWISTYTKKRVHYLNPRTEEIDIKDIAHALSLVCRFGGHCKEFYSMAEHSVRVAFEVDRDHRLPALLHDAHEAYLHDVPRPIKQDIRGYKEIADRLQRIVDIKFGSYQNLDIKRADRILLATEARDLGFDISDWERLPPPLLEPIDPWCWQDAEETFLTYFELWRNRDLTTT